MPTPEELTQLQGGIASIVKPVLAFAGAANPVTASVMFGVDILFKFLSLGAKIRSALEEQKLTLDSMVRAEGIVRVPVAVDMTIDDVTTFFVRNKSLRFDHPHMAVQFAPEIQAVQDVGSSDFARALHILNAAKRIIPPIEEQLHFDDDPVMDQVFAAMLDPGKPDFRTLVFDFVALVDKKQLSLGGHVGQIPEFALSRFRAAGLQLNQDAEDAAKQVNAKIGGLIRDTLFGDKGVIQTTTQFAVGRRVDFINAEMNQLKDEQAAIQAKPAEEQTAADKKRLDDIPKRLEQLTDFTTRLQDSLKA